MHFVIIYFKYIFCSDVVYFQLDGVGGGVSLYYDRTD